MRKLLIDTDIGDDIDDALALALAVKSGELDIVGVTCVYKNTVLRSRQAKKVLSLCGATDTPVYAGFGKPLKEPGDENEVICQYTEDLKLSQYDYENPQEGVNGESAIDFILEMVRRYEQELTVLAIGPLTNIAKAILKDPETMQRVGKILLMGGNYQVNKSEWNIRCDPEAAEVLFESGLPIYCVGDEITSRFVLSEQELSGVLAKTTDPLRKYFLEIVPMWIRASRRMPILHDPITLQALIYPDHFTFEKTRVRVETSKEFSRGRTVREDQDSATSEASRTYVACDVDEAFCRKMFFKTVFPFVSENYEIITLSQVLKGAM